MKTITYDYQYIDVVYCKF